jgi:hypothetical protein
MVIRHVIRHASALLSESELRTDQVLPSYLTAEWGGLAGRPAGFLATRCGRGVEGRSGAWPTDPSDRRNLLSFSTFELWRGVLCCLPVWQYVRFGSTYGLAVRTVWQYVRFGSTYGLAVRTVWQFVRFGSTYGLTVRTVWQYVRFLYSVNRPTLTVPYTKQLAHTIHTHDIGQVLRVSALYIHLLRATPIFKHTELWYSLWCSNTHCHKTLQSY